MSKFSELFSHYRQAWLVTTLFPPLLIVILGEVWDVSKVIQIFTVWGLAWPFTCVTYPGFTWVYYRDEDFLRAGASLFTMIIPIAAFVWSFMRHKRSLAVELGEEKIGIGTMVDYYLGERTSAASAEGENSAKEGEGEARGTAAENAESSGDKTPDTPGDSAEEEGEEKKENSTS